MAQADEFCLVICSESLIMSKSVEAKLIVVSFKLVKRLLKQTPVMPEGCVIAIYTTCVLEELRIFKLTKNVNSEKQGHLTK